MSNSLKSALISAAVSVAVLVCGLLLVGGNQSAPEGGHTPPSGQLGAASVNWFERGIGWISEGVYVGDLQEFSVDSNGQVSSATTTNTTSYWTVGGVDYASVQVSMTATSSAICSIANPFGVSGVAVLNFLASTTANGIAVAQTLDVSTSSTAIGSSSPAFIKEFAVPASTAWNALWLPAATTSTRLIGIDPYRGHYSAILGASERVNARIASGTPGTFAAYYTGSCSATFMKP